MILCQLSRRFISNWRHQKISVIINPGGDISWVGRPCRNFNRLERNRNEKNWRNYHVMAIKLTTLDTQRINTLKGQPGGWSILVWMKHAWGRSRYEQRMASARLKCSRRELSDRVRAWDTASGFKYPGLNSMLPHKSSSRLAGILPIGSHSLLHSCYSTLAWIGWEHPTDQYSWSKIYAKLGTSHIMK